MDWMDTKLQIPCPNSKFRLVAKWEHGKTRRYTTFWRMNDMLGRQWLEKAIQRLHFPTKKSEIMVNVKCTCCQIVIRRLYPRKYLTEYRHFCNQEKTHTLVQQTRHSAENYIAQIAGGHSNGNLQMIKCIGSAIRISRMLHHALHHHIIRRI